MSTVDTLINAVAAVTVNDIYRPLVKDKPDRHYLKIAMATSALAGGFSVVGGLVISYHYDTSAGATMSGMAGRW